MFVSWCITVCVCIYILYRLVKHLATKKVAQVACGNEHSLVLLKSKFLSSFVIFCFKLFCEVLLCSRKIANNYQALLLAIIIFVLQMGSCFHLAKTTTAKWAWVPKLSLKLLQ